MNFDESPRFQKELKRLGKKYPSLAKDMQLFRRAVSTFPLGRNKKHCHIIVQNDFTCIVKTRVFCKSLRGSFLRIIYAYFEQQQRVDFIELYFKGDKQNEDRDRIREYLKNFPAKPKHRHSI